LASLVNCTQNLISYEFKLKLSNNTPNALLSEPASPNNLEIVLNIPTWVTSIRIGRNPPQFVSLNYDLESKDSFIESSQSNSSDGIALLIESTNPKEYGSVRFSMRSDPYS
ncbi:6551_t:CDS:2, partial [Dentiscutata heterogama]